MAEKIGDNFNEPEIETQSLSAAKNKEQQELPPINGERVKIVGSEAQLKRLLDIKKKQYDNLLAIYAARDGSLEYLDGYIQVQRFPDKIRIGQGYQEINSGRCLTLKNNSERDDIEIDYDTYMTLLENNKAQAKIDKKMKK